MKNLISKNKIILVTMFCFFALPMISYAMTVAVEKPQEEIKINDVVILNIFINTDGKEINSIDGEIKMSGNYEIKNLSTSGSVFNLWPNKPSYSNNSISFVGGTTAGVFGSKLKVFSIAVKPLDNKGISFSSDNISLFLNDGAGTSVVADNMKENIPVAISTSETKNELEKIILEDKTLPKDFEIVIGRDPNLFDGQYFASFNTVDDESGINRYEVIEEGYPSVRSGNTYVIRNQNLKGSIIVKAIDNAGNVRSVNAKMSNIISGEKNINWFALSISIVLLILIKLIFKFFKRKNAKSY